MCHPILFVFVVGVHDNLHLDALFAFLVSFDHMLAYVPCR
jgi:hypothetical protein